MSFSRRLCPFGLTGLTGFVLMMLSALSADALVTEVVGPQPDAAAQSWWPEGVEILARHPTRVYARQSDVAETIYFMADPAAMVNLLKAFAAIDVEEHPVTRLAETAHARDFEGKEHAYTVRLEIPDPAMARLRFPDKPAPLPHLTVYLKESDALTLPEGLHLTDDVPAYRAAPSTDATGSTETSKNPSETKDERDTSAVSPGEEKRKTSRVPKR